MRITIAAALLGAIPEIAILEFWGTFAGTSLVYLNGPLVREVYLCGYNIGFPTSGHFIEPMPGFGELPILPLFILRKSNQDPITKLIWNRVAVPVVAVFVAALGSLESVLSQLPG